ASVYITVSWSAQTRSPCRSVSSAVFTITVSRAPTTACSPSASFAPPTPPASTTTGRSFSAYRDPCSVTVQKGPDLADPVDRLAVERRRQAGDHGPEPEIAVRSDRLSDGRGRRGTGRTGPRGRSARRRGGGAGA